MPYLGRSSNFGVRSVFHFLASNGDTSISGADADGKTLSFADGNYIDVYLNGVRLKTGEDYNTATANTIAGLSALNANDEVNVVVYDAFSLATGFETLGGTFGDDITFKKDGVALNFGIDSDVTITHDPDDGLIFKSAATGDDNPFLLTLQTGETDIAADDVLGEIRFRAPDEGTGTDATLTAASIAAISEGDFSSSSNATKLVFKTGSSETATEKMSISSTGLVTISRSDNAENLSLVSTDADASVGPTLRMDRQSASAADGDLLGKINFVGHNDAGTPEDIAYAGITAIINDATDGTEDGKLAINTIVAGTERSRVFIDAGETVINEDSVDVDFRVESNGNTHALFVDAGNGHVNINTDTDLGSDLNINGEITLANANSGIIMVENAADAFGSNFTMRKSRNTTLNGHTVVQDGDVTGNINFQASDGTDFHSTASIASAVDGTPGNNDMPGRLVFSVTADGASSPTEVVRIEEDGHFLIGQTDDQGGHKFLVYEGVNDNAAIFRNGHASFSETSVTINANRSATNDYDFLVCGSNNGADAEFIFRGDGNAACDGSFSGGGADYAEYFEWKDGNSSSEDRIGISVKLDGDKIVASSNSDNASDIIGVISANPAVTGDGANLKWNNKYLTDDYGRYIREEYTATEWTEVKTSGDGSRQEKHHVYETDKIPSDVTVPSDAKVISVDDKGAKLTRRKLNPDYDASKTYIARPERKEWDAVGLMGKLRMKKGQKTGTNWIKMRDVSDTVEEWLVR